MRREGRGEKGERGMMMKMDENLLPFPPRPRPKIGRRVSDTGSYKIARILAK